MRSSVWESTLAQFRDDVASRKPVPASGCVSAITASSALSLLIKVLEIAANKKGFAADPGRLASLRDAARTESSRLAQYADDDVAAFNAYLVSTRLPKSNDEERERRKQAMASALQEGIKVPLEAARSAVRGIDLCADAVGVVPKSLIADVGGAVALLAGAARGLIISVEFNIWQLAGDGRAYDNLIAELLDLEHKVLRREDSVRGQVASAIGKKDQ